MNENRNEINKEGTKECKHCFHKIISQRVGWLHIKSSETQGRTELNNSKGGIASNACSINDCKCRNPEP